MVIQLICPHRITIGYFFLYHLQDNEMNDFVQVLADLLKPRGWKPPVRRQFILDCGEIAELCENAERIFAREPSVLQIKAPVSAATATPAEPVLKKLYEYDLPTVAGKIYEFEF